MPCCSPVNLYGESRCTGHAYGDDDPDYCESRLCYIALAQYEFDFDDTIGWQEGHMSRDKAERFESWSLGE